MQLQLPFAADEQTLAAYLKKSTGAEVRLTVTDNSSSMISVRKERGVVVLRLHRIFLKAGPDVLHEIAGFIKNLKLKTPLVRRFILDHAGSLPSRTRKRQPIKTMGSYHDLARLALCVNRDYFEGGITTPVTWGTKKTGHSARRRILGSYNSRTDIIRINPILDRKNVPRYYLEFIIYHEMLHADLGVRKKNGRREVHSREFKRRERLFRDYDKALLWEKTGRHLPQTLDPDIR
ncbi:MAG: hypothetical protein HZB33_15430 [Nitrospirae bacterium]|nr:hypothetical protein [Nitrospirota bacterium]